MGHVRPGRGDVRLCEAINYYDPSFVKGLRAYAAPCQMHVSRLQARALARLRELLLGPGHASPPGQAARD